MRTRKLLAAPVKPEKLPAPLKNMITIFGRSYGKQCGACARFQVISGQPTCSGVSSKKMDWKPEWPACGRWSARSENNDGPETRS